jgi:sugar/nucleoside kinase (ribokinase family)
MSDNRTSIMTVGAATQDVFISGKALMARRDVRTRDYVEQFPLGAKLDLDGVIFDTGGGATNAAVTFARQGFKANFVGKIGHDPAGSEVLRVLRREGVGTDQVAYDTKTKTGYAVIMQASNGERTILAYRGASHNLAAKDFAIRNFKPDWFYISSLAGNLDLLGKLLKHANTHGIQVAFNPGGGELANPKKLRTLLPLVNVLVANAEEMALLYPADSPAAVLRRAAAVCPYVVLTDGAKGSLATDGVKVYASGQYQKVKVVDRTGAGDAFGSGFVAGLAGGLAMEDALTLASANSTSVVQHVGAKPGILKTRRLKRMKIKVTKL